MKKYKGKLIYLPRDKMYWLIDPINAANLLTPAYGPPALLKKLVKKRLVEIKTDQESYSIKAVLKTRKRTKKTSGK